MNGNFRFRLTRRSLVFLFILAGSMASSLSTAVLIWFPRRTVQKMFLLATLKRIHATLPDSKSNAPSPTPSSKADKGRTSPTIAWFDQNVVDCLKFSGSRSLGLHFYNVSGDVASYNSLNQYGEGSSTFTDVGTSSLAGDKVLGVLSFQMNLPDQRLNDPTTQQIRLDYSKGPVKVSEGDIQGSLGTDNPLASFSKSLKGTELGVSEKRFQFKALYSETKGVSRTVSIPGANSVGPYYLESGKIQDNNIEVEVDGVPMRQGGPGEGDYTADTQTGSITFNSRIIPPTSTILVTYEAISPNSTPGILEGASANYDMGRYGRFGLTAAQLKGSGVSGDGTITDAFQFYQNGVFTLSYEPVVGTIVVQLDTRQLFQGQWQNGAVVGGDYAINPLESRQIIVSPSIVAPNDGASGATLYVRYQPSSVQTINGDRRIWGFDYRLPFGPKAYVQYDQANGSTIDTTNNTGGIARDLSASWKTGPLSLSGALKDIPVNFVSIDSESFSRNEQSCQVQADLTQKRFGYGLSYSNSVVQQDASSLQVTSGTTATTTSTSADATNLINARSTVAKAYARYSAPDGISWNLSETRTTSHALFDSDLDTTSFTGSRNWGRVKVSSGVDLQNGTGPLTNASGTLVEGGLSLLTYHVDLGYEPIKNLELSSRTSISDVTAFGQTNQGQDISFNSSYKPGKQWSFNLGATYSDAGQAAALAGFSNGTGVGYGSGNGFSQGAAGDGYIGAANSIYDNTQARVGYQPTDRLGFDVSYISQRTVGALASNTSSNTLSLDTDWDLGRINILHVSLNRTLTQYLESNQNQESSATDVRISLNGAPKGKWTYLVGFGTLLPGGSGLYEQRSLDYDFSLNYAVAKRQRVGFMYSDGIYSGPYGQDLHEIKLTYGYSIFKGVELQAGYGIHQASNEGPLATTGAYRAAGFDFNLNLGI